MSESLYMVYPAYMPGTTYNFRMSDTGMDFFNVNNVATSPYKSDIIIFVNHIVKKKLLKINERLIIPN